MLKKNDRFIFGCVNEDIYIAGYKVEKLLTKS